MIIDYAKWSAKYRWIWSLLARFVPVPSIATLLALGPTFVTGAIPLMLVIIAESDLLHVRMAFLAATYIVTTSSQFYA